VQPRLAELGVTDVYLVTDPRLQLADGVFAVQICQDHPNHFLLRVLDRNDDARHWRARVILNNPFVNGI
jgi:hypothetical protein